ncbi:hypothetical protein D9757_006317 [Collybiopsis confluens]|uniref:Rhodanese domain-containing protein n=1 Tax=Collybiopsis confluens TaxID=2823264 RepID=A0A8H5HHD6_9AGAR|nr:hypothetical protein D9757_006317 [Collybiopsis confluens]
MSLLRSSVSRTVASAAWNNARLANARLLRHTHPVRFNSSARGPIPRPVQKEKEFNAVRDWDAKVISYEGLKPKTESPTPNSWLIDVREPDEVMQGMIPSAVNIPLTVLPESLHALPEQFREKFGFEQPGRDQEVTFYCRSGVRSTSACDIAKRNGYTNILNYKGSWLDWSDRESKK